MGRSLALGSLVIRLSVASRELSLTHLGVKVFPTTVARNHLAALLHRDLVRADRTTFRALCHASSVSHSFYPGESGKFWER